MSVDPSRIRQNHQLSPAEEQYINLHREQNFDIEALHKLDGLQMQTVNYEDEAKLELVEPTNAANKYYDKHACAALDKFK